MTKTHSFESNSSVDLVHFYCEFVLDPLYLMSAMHREIFHVKTSVDTQTHRQILTHRFELIDGVSVIMILLPFPLQQL